MLVYLKNKQFFFQINIISNFTSILDLGTLPKMTMKIFFSAKGIQEEIRRNLPETKEHTNISNVAKTFQ